MELEGRAKGSEVPRPLAPGWGRLRGKALRAGAQRRGRVTGSRSGPPPSVTYLVTALFLAHLAVPAKLLEPFGLNSIRDGLWAQKIRFAHGDPERHKAEAAGSGTGSVRGQAGLKLTAGVGGAREFEASELTRLSETEDASEEGGCAGSCRARAVSPVCPTFKVPPCSRGRVLPGCRPAPCNHNGMISSVGMWGSGCCEAGGIEPHAHSGPGKVRAPARPGRSGRGNVSKAGRARARSRAGVKGNKVTAWSPGPGTAIRDLRTRTGVRLSVGAICVPISSVLPLRTLVHVLQSL